VNGCKENYIVLLNIRWSATDPLCLCFSIWIPTCCCCVFVLHTGLSFRICVLCIRLLHTFCSKSLLQFLDPHLMLRLN